MDGSGRAVPDKEVSIKSYAIEYAQGKVCLLNTNVAYQGANTIDKDGTVNTPELKTSTKQEPLIFKSNWYDTEDPDYNYTLDKDADININDDGSVGNGRLDPINPVAIINGKVSEDGYSFTTDEVGRADFEIRYPIRYSTWVKVRFDASTVLNGSESTQSINYVLPYSQSTIKLVQPIL